ncbi:3-dehydroquinate dehydratase [Erythrobacter litoralis]|uniref:type II 3-dehydroquinate dehydratase n=1 Tax=Erythrobacter litoralis TaxID=39960 RepID=UPI0024354BB9|nr:3-dehydroquinate dehydratase [Erythrobacter litoralis]MDG6078597.1 3-dehydroquinate dehydratase [Erythrobacter litoralis]
MRMPRTIFILNGPNLNLLGTREPEIYGTATLADIERDCRTEADVYGFDIVFRQSNHEGDLVDWLHEAHREGATAVLLNAGAYTHTSIALHDAIKSISVPVIEVHLSDPETREPFRHLSYVGIAAADCVKGLGARSYIVALQKAAEIAA